MPKFNQPCTICGTLSRGSSLCETHQKEKNKAKEGARAGRGNRVGKSQLYNYAYRQEAKRIKAEATHCHICQRPFMSGDRVEADHIIPGLQGGPLAAAHARCNQSRGNKPLEGTA